MREIPEGTKCRNCKKRPATERWVANGGALDLVHGFWEPWCEICVVQKQVMYLQERLKDLPALEAKLEKLMAADADG